MESVVAFTEESTVLTLDERSRLGKYESVISNGLQTCFDVGRALLAIRDEKLYRLSHETFEEYCEAKWQLSRRHAYRMIESAEVIENVSHGTQTNVLPANERQARPLAKLPPTEQPAAWQEAVEESGGKPTAKDVEKAVDRRLISAQPIIHAKPIEGVFGSLEPIIQTGQKFGSIYADPPWRYDNRATRSSVESIYAGTMTVDELCEMPIGELAADDAHLHLWVTAAFLPFGFRIMEAWGFEYRTYFVWCKPQMGIGNYWRKSSELMLTGIRGNAKRFAVHNKKDWMVFDRTKHSAKPNEIRELVTEVSPGPYLELFGRKQIHGWTVFGNQVEAAEPAIE